MNSMSAHQTAGGERDDCQPQSKVVYCGKKVALKKKATDSDRSDCFNRRKTRFNQFLRVSKKGNGKVWECEESTYVKNGLVTPRVLTV